MGATKGSIKERLETTIRNFVNGAAGCRGSLERDALAEIVSLEAEVEQLEADLYWARDQSHRQARLAGQLQWECKDYADGWIKFHTQDAAMAYQAETGCLMRVYIKAGAVAATWPEPSELMGELLDDEENWPVVEPGSPAEAWLEVAHLFGATIYRGDWALHLVHVDMFVQAGIIGDPRPDMCCNWASTMPLARFSALQGAL